MNVEALVERETELREQASELDRELVRVRDELRRASDDGDVTAVTDLREALAALQEERDDLRKELRAAGEARLRATQAAEADKVRREVEETKAELDALFAAPFDSVDELREALAKFNIEGFKKTALARINQAQPLLKRLQHYRAHYRSAWNWQDVVDFENRLNAVKTMLNVKFGR